MTPWQARRTGKPPNNLNLHNNTYNTCQCAVTRQHESYEQAKAATKAQKLQHREHRVLERLSLRLRTQALVHNALSVQLDSVLIKAKALLHNAGQLTNALAVLA